MSYPSKFFIFLLLAVFISGCVGSVETAPVKEIVIGLSPPISDDLLSAINLAGSGIKSVYTGMDLPAKKGGVYRWSVSAISNSSFSSILLIEANSSVLAEEREEFQIREPVIYVSPYLFYRGPYIMRFCEKYFILAYSDSNESFWNILEAVKKDGCLQKDNESFVSVTLPTSSAFSQEVNMYLKSKGYVPSFVKISETDIDLGFSHNNSSLLFITQSAHDYGKYAEYLDFERKYENSSAVIKTMPFRNGEYKLFNMPRIGNEDRTIRSKILWYCSGAASTMVVSSQTGVPQAPLSYDEITEISKLLCP